MVAPMLRGTLVLVTIFSVIGEQSQTYTQRQTPGVPTSPQIDGALLDPEMGDSHRILLLSWTAPSSNAGPVLGYRLLCQTDGVNTNHPSGPEAHLVTGNGFDPGGEYRGCGE